VALPQAMARRKKLGKGNPMEMVNFRQLGRRFRENHQKRRFLSLK
jgi:hypothetical protein